MEGVRVHRLPVASARDMNEFSRLTRRMEEHPGEVLPEEWMRAQGPDCPGLLDEIRRLRGVADLFIFFSYLYSPTYFGLPIVREKAVLVPMAHDEPTLRYPLFRRLFEDVRYLLYNTPEEARLLRSRFRIGPDRGEVLGVASTGMDTAPRVPNPLTGRQYGIFIGRIDYPKGAGELFHYFVQNGLNRQLELAVVGEAKFEVPKAQGVHHFDSAEDPLKFALLRDAALLFQPSPYESLSLSVIEAWMAGVPVLANGKCEVLQGQCRRSGGGWVYDGEADFVAKTEQLLQRPALRTAMSIRGGRYVRGVYDWSRIEARFRALLEDSTGDDRGSGDAGGEARRK